MFNKAIIAALFLDNFKMLNITLYNSKGDLAADIKVFCLWMDFERVLELARCRAFPLTLLGLAQSWHNKLPSVSLTSFE